MFAALGVALWSAQVGEAAQSYLGTPLNPAGGADATEAPIRIVRVTESEADVRLDGRLDEPVWHRLPAYDHMVVTWPDKGEPAAHRTHTFLFYTERGLYVGAWNEQPPETMVGGLSGRDVFDQLDGYQIVIDSSGNGLYGYWFRVKLGGSLMDGTLLPERRMESNWDGPWRGRTQAGDDGWTVEMFLPWAMLNMPEADGERRMALEMRIQWATLSLADRPAVGSVRRLQPHRRPAEPGPPRQLRRSAGRQFRNAARGRRPRQAALSVRAVGALLLARTTNAQHDWRCVHKLGCAMLLACQRSASRLGRHWRLSGKAIGRPRNCFSHRFRRSLSTSFAVAILRRSSTQSMPRSKAQWTDRLSANPFCTRSLPPLATGMMCAASTS